MPGQMELFEAQQVVSQWLEGELAQGKDHRCPTCGQLAKVYARTINSRQAAALITLYRAAGLGDAHVPSLAPRLATAVRSVACVTGA